MKRCKTFFRNFFLFLIFLFISHLSFAQVYEYPEPAVIDISKLNLLKQKYQSGDKEFDRIIGKLINSANKILLIKPLSVMEKKIFPPSGSKHDYMSMGPYWWPDSSKADGKPYLRRDGERNPEALDIPDHDYFRATNEYIFILSMSHFFTSEKKYADAAIEKMRVWYLNENTKMNPNLNYAQSIPGRNDGRGAGIIDSRSIILLLESIYLLKYTKAISNDDLNGIIDWLKKYLSWLLESKNGKDEQNAKNNHGSWYDAQVIGLYLFFDKIEEAKNHLKNVTIKRMVKQITADGKQPAELVRTKSYHYSLFNLEALINIAISSEKVGINLWNYSENGSGTIKTAIDFLIPCTLN